jgi:hypothetical protein
MGSGERPLSAVPRAVWLALLAALILQIAWQWAQPKPVASAVALSAPPPVAALRVAGLGEPVVLAQLMTLYLQAFDNQPGISIPFRDLDYRRVTQWLETILALDAAGQYPLLMAAELYSQAAIIAKHRLHDDQLALRYARDIVRLAPAAPGWARQMHIFILEDIGEVESAKILLGGLLASGEIKDERELHFLTERLEDLKNAEKSSPPAKK